MLFPCLKSRNLFLFCNHYNTGKMARKVKSYNKDLLRATIPGQSFHMDYGFVRGKDTSKQEDVLLITSKDCYNCYLLISDEYSRHMWVFLYVDKKPPVETITTFIVTHGNKTDIKLICTNQGG